MRLVTNTGCLEETFGLEKTVEILAKAGFDGIDLSMCGMEKDDDYWSGDDWREKAEALKKAGEKWNIPFTQAHAPFPSSRGKEATDAKILERIKRSVEICEILNIPYIIVHPKVHLHYIGHRKELYDMSVQMYLDLVPFCEEKGVHVCIENMYDYDSRRKIVTDSLCAQPEEFCQMIDEVGSRWIPACLDIGHAALVGVDPADAIRALGRERLQALHVHDVDYFHDCHTLPYMEDLDWDSITAALGEIDYQGDFTFEADTFLWKLPAPLREEGVAFMAKTGRYLVGLVEAARRK